MLKMSSSIIVFSCVALTLFSNGCKRTIATDSETFAPDKTLSLTETSGSGVAFKEYLGINAFEWDLASESAHEQIDPSRLETIKSFGGMRHYLDWERIEPVEGAFSYSPAHNGGWDYDLIYQTMKNAGKYVLVDLKTCPSWLLNSYPANLRDGENVPAPYGLDRSKPLSYIKQARAAFQLAARYGTNKNVDTALLLIDPSIRWTGDPRNTKKIGLGTVNYIECDNERDKWWKGEGTKQTAEEYAANLSAFYDGDQGRLGKGVGVKNADPNMIVVMGGLADPNPEYVEKLINWCAANRGRKANGQIDLCFDVINYHLYANDATTVYATATRGIAPELSNLRTVADKFSSLSKSKAANIPVWVTETGYDVGEHTPQRAIAIGNKSSQVTQADWNLRTALLYARSGISKCIFYMLENVDVNSWTQYTSSGFVNPDRSKRPSADFFLQANKLLGEYFYQSSLSNDPNVDVYALNGKKMYVLSIPDQTARTATYELNLGSATQAVIYTPATGQTEMSSRVVDTQNGKIQITVTETPVFVAAK